MGGLLLGFGFLLFFSALLAALVFWLDGPEKTAPELPEEMPQESVVAPPSPSVSAPKSVVAVVKARSAEPVAEHFSAPPREEPRKSPEQLLENWDLAGTGLSEKDMLPLLSHGQPESLMVFGDKGVRQVFPRQMEKGDSQSEQTAFVATKGAIKKVADERRERAEARAQKAQHALPPGLRRLPGNAYEVVFFRPGRSDKGEAVRPVSADTLAAIQGPDYSLANFDSKDDRLMVAHLSKILSLGHGGEIMVKVTGDGFLADEPGFDFALFENSLGRGNQTYMMEFGSVGVSESEEPGSFRWFDCDPRKKVLLGCFGMVPTAEGGDRFDLAEVGVKQARYIWIKDLGISRNWSSKWSTEGCDLDALRFDHAYTK
jgi:hypothetical protein